MKNFISRMLVVIMVILLYLAQAYSAVISDDSKIISSSLPTTLTQNMPSDGTVTDYEYSVNSLDKS